VLTNGQRINLTYLKDTDLDGIFDNEEYLLGTDKADQDTDADGLTDYHEAKTGWDVVVKGRHTMSILIRVSPMSTEIIWRIPPRWSPATDCYNKDTDGDGVADTNDQYPLSPRPARQHARSGGLVERDPGHGLDRHGPGYVDHCRDRRSARICQQRYPRQRRMRQLIDWWPAYIIPSGTNPVIGLNPGPTQKDQSLDIADNASLDARRSISPQYQFTLSAWVYWNGTATGAPWATVLSKGAPAAATYGLFVKDNGAVALSLYRSYHEKCWYCWFGTNSTCDDGSCADDTHTDRPWMETPTYRCPADVGASDRHLRRGVYAHLCRRGQGG